MNKFLGCTSICFMLCLPLGVQAQSATWYGPACDYSSTESGRYPCKPQAVSGPEGRR